MKLYEIISESNSQTHLYYPEAVSEFDEMHNSENFKYRVSNKKYYKDRPKSAGTSVLSKPGKSEEPKYTNKPKNGGMQSPGYRGYNYVLARTGQRYDKHVGPVPSGKVGETPPVSDLF